jgi:hypothetical protein
MSEAAFTHYGEIVKGTTSKILRIFVGDSSVTTGAGLTGLVFNTASLVAHYSREGDAAETAITLVTATEGTFTSSGFIQMDSTDLPGWYELGIPNAAIATGANSVGVTLHGAANMRPVNIYIDLVDPVISPVHTDWGMVKQSTNIHKLIGPVINKETGAPITSVTLGDITAARVTQTGATVTRTAITLAGSGNNQFTHVGDGYWELDMTATDTGTLGNLAITLRDDDLFHPIHATALVVPANVWDSLVGGTDALDASVIQWLGTAVTAATAGVPNVNMTEIAGDGTDASDLGAAIDNANNLVFSDATRISASSTAADNCQLMFDGSGYAGGTTKLDVNSVQISGNTQTANVLEAMMRAIYDPTGGNTFDVDDSAFAPTTTSFETTNGDSTNDHYNNMTILWVTGALRGSKYDVSDYVGATARWTVPTMTDTPSDGDTFILI